MCWVWGLLKENNQEDKSWQTSDLVNINSVGP